jgi:hypothetical protein
MSTRGPRETARVAEVMATTREKVNKLVREAEQKIHDNYEESRVMANTAVAEARQLAKKKMDTKLDELADFQVPSNHNNPLSRLHTVDTLLKKCTEDINKIAQSFDKLDSFCKAQEQELERAVQL